MYFLKVLGAGRLRSRCQQVGFLLKSLSLACRCLSSSCIFTSFFSLLIICVLIPLQWGPRAYWSRAHSSDLILTLSPLQRPYLQMRSHSEVLLVRTSTCEFGGNTVQTITDTIFHPTDWPKKKPDACWWTSTRARRNLPHCCSECEPPNHSRKDHSNFIKLNTHVFYDPVMPQLKEILHVCPKRHTENYSLEIWFIKKNGYTCTTKSLFCTAEINTTL